MIDLITAYLRPIQRVKKSENKLEFSDTTTKWSKNISEHLYYSLFSVISMPSEWQPDRDTTPLVTGIF